jgi:hypothetical protein
MMIALDIVAALGGTTAAAFWFLAAFVKVTALSATWDSINDDLSELRVVLRRLAFFNAIGAVGTGVAACCCREGDPNPRCAEG